MLSKIKHLKSRLKRLYAKRNAAAWVSYLRSQGVRIGKGTTIFAKPFEVTIDTTRPWLIEIGDNVQITKGVTILTHGYDWSVLKGVYGDLYGSSGKVKIGNNCFIGMNTTILKGSVVGDNVIIGAGSMLTGKTYPSNCVIAGSPARVICSLDDYFKKRKDDQLNEAKELVQEYYKVYGVAPNKNSLSEFFWLFEKRGKINEPSFNYQMNQIGNYKASYEKFLQTEPMFNSFEEFIAYCLKDIKD